MNVHAQPIKTNMLIGGELVAGEANNWLDSVNPANEEKIGEVPAGDDQARPAAKTGDSLGSGQAAGNLAPGQVVLQLKGNITPIRQIQVTVVHEIGHHFGLSDARLHELGWG